MSLAAALDQLRFSGLRSRSSCLLQALDFLEQLLVYDPKKRLSATDASSVSPSSPASVDVNFQLRSSGVHAPFCLAYTAQTCLFEHTDA